MGYYQKNKIGYDSHKCFMFYVSCFMRGTYFVAIIIFIIAWFSVISPARAASIYFSETNQTLALDQTFKIRIYVSSENKDINALEGKIVYPADLLELQTIDDGNSVINFWIQKPSVSRETDDKQTRETDAEIIFAGLIPGGFSGKEGKIISLQFATKKQGRGVIDIKDLTALLNDGKGTKTDVSISDFNFEISKDAPLALVPEQEKDTTPPEVFFPVISKDPNVFNGKWFVVFATQDKDSGIDYYAIRETRRKIDIKRKTDAKKWQKAESPYLLKDQKLHSYIYVKAVDKAGNERVEVINPTNPLLWYQNMINWFIIIIIGLIVAFLLIYRNKYAKQRKTEHETTRI